VDTRTGDVVAEDAGIAPDLVSPYAGLVYGDNAVEIHLPSRRAGRSMP
jgi:hypothetical protein